MGNEITPVKMLELAKSGWDAIIELYKNSDAETRKLILKALAMLAGFKVLVEHLKRL